MKIKSLLAAVSMAALMASPAAAIEIANTGTDFTTPLALELDLANSPVAGTFLSDVTLTSGGNYSQGINHTVTVNLPAGVTFGAGITGNSITANPSVTNGTVFSGGAEGDSQVVFRISPNGTTDNRFSFDLPLAVNGCPSADAGVQILVEDNLGFVENDQDGATTGAGSFGGCESAFDGTITSDKPTADTQIALDDYDALTDGGVLGTIQYEIDTAVGVDAAGTAMTAADVLTVVHTITLAGNPDEDGVVLSSDVGSLVPAPADQAETWTLTMTGAEAIAGATITATASGEPLPSMTTIVSAGVVTFDPTAGAPEFIPSEAGPSGALDDLQREGQAFGFFDWNSGQAGAQRLNVYRVTGLEPSSMTRYTVEVENADVTAAEGTVTGYLTSDAAGEAVLTDSMIAAMLPADVARFDFGINIETGNDIDIDRLMSTGGIVTSFNDGANNDPNDAAQPTTDADNGGSE